MKMSVTWYSNMYLSSAYLASFCIHLCTLISVGVSVLFQAVREHRHDLLECLPVGVANLEIIVCVCRPSLLVLGPLERQTDDHGPAVQLARFCPSNRSCLHK